MNSLFYENNGDLFMNQKQKEVSHLEDDFRKQDNQIYSQLTYNLE